MRRAPVIFDWLAAQSPGGSGFVGALGEGLRRLAHRGLAILLSDWWVDDAEADLKVLSSLRQEIIAVHIVSPQELDPVQLGAGEARLVASESAHEIELLLDENVLDGYRTACAAWQGRVRQQVIHQRGPPLPVSADANPARPLPPGW